MSQPYSLFSLPPISSQQVDRLKAEGRSTARGLVVPVPPSQPPSTQSRMSKGEEWMGKGREEIRGVTTNIYVRFSVKVTHVLTH